MDTEADGVGQEQGSWPWCEDCQSWHHPRNLTCCGREGREFPVEDIHLTWYPWGPGVYKILGPGTQLVISYTWDGRAWRLERLGGYTPLGDEELRKWVERNLV